MSEPFANPYAAAAAAAAAAGSITSGVLKSNAASTAAKQVAGGNQTAQQAYEKALAQYEQLQNPYAQAGYLGLPALTSHLGLDPGSINQAIGQTTAAQSVDASPQRILQMFPDVMAEYQRLSPNNLKNNLGVTTPEQFATWWWNQYGQFDPSRAQALGGGAANTPAPVPAPAAPAVPSQGQEPAQYSTAIYTAPTYTPPPAYAPTAYTAPDPFSYALDQYQASPAYQYQVDQAQKATLANAAATGSLQSGAAAKALQNQSQQLAYQDYGAERDFAYNQYSADRSFGRSNYDSDRNFDYGRYVNDLNFGRQTYQDDRNFDYGQFTDQRDYDANRYDQQTRDLLGLTALGQGANTGVANALLGYGGQAAGLAQKTGQAYAGATLQQGNAMAGIASALGGVGSSYLSGLAKAQQTNRSQPSLDVSRMGDV
jgi:hypothetical protein